MNSIERSEKMISHSEEIKRREEFLEALKEDKELNIMSEKEYSYMSLQHHYYFELNKDEKNFLKQTNLERLDYLKKELVKLSQS